MEADLIIDIKGLKKLVEDLKTQKEIQVGVFDDERSASIGFKHEFGDPETKLPMRSFLTMPITKKQYQLQDVAQETLEQTKNINKVYAETAKMAKSIVDSAFETGGFGEWKQLTEQAVKSKTNKKNSNKILIDTGQLRRSIKARVVSI